MIPIVWILCGIYLLVYSILKKNKPEKVLASKARQRKPDLTDEQYVNRVYKNSIILGILMVVLGILWIIVNG